MTILNYNKSHTWRFRKYYRTEIDKSGGPIANQYEDIMNRESAALDPYFTGDTLNNMLEIGPGIGVFSALLHKKYGPDLYLIEGGTGRPDTDDTIGWRADNPTPCADIEALEDFLWDNDIIRFNLLEALPGERYRLIENDKPDFDTVELEDVWPSVKFDLIVSLRSWCWHYDADVYLDFVVQHSIPRHTLLLVDSRRHHGQPEKLYDHFKTIKKVKTGIDSYKMTRLLMVKK